MTLHIENSQGFHQKPFGSKREFNEVVGYKINTPKLVAFLHANNEVGEREIRVTIPFTVTHMHTNTHIQTRNKLNKGGEGYVLGKLQTTYERN